MKYHLQFTGQAAKPSLVADIQNPTDGDVITLTCSSTTSGVTKYEFLKENVVIHSGPNAFRVIGPAVIGTDDKSYTCIAYIDNIASDTSDPHVISRKS